MKHYFNVKRSAAAVFALMIAAGCRPSGKNIISASAHSNKHIMSSYAGKDMSSVGADAEKASKDTKEAVESDASEKIEKAENAVIISENAKKDAENKAATAAEAEEAAQNALAFAETAEAAAEKAAGKTKSAEEALQKAQDELNNAMDDLEKAEKAAAEAQETAEAKADEARAAAEAAEKAALAAACICNLTIEDALEKLDNMQKAIIASKNACEDAEKAATNSAAAKKAAKDANIKAEKKADEVKKAERAVNAAKEAEQKAQDEADKAKAAANEAVENAKEKAYEAKIAGQTAKEAEENADRALNDAVNTANKDDEDAEQNFEDDETGSDTVTDITVEQNASYADAVQNKDEKHPDDKISDGLKTTDDEDRTVQTEQNPDDAENTENIENNDISPSEGPANKDDDALSSALEAAEKEAAELKAALEAVQSEKTEADKTAADKVIEKIKEIGTVELTNECENLILSAKAAYEILTDEQKALVTNYSDLTNAEQTYSTLPQTGLSGIHTVISGLAALMGIAGFELVRKSRNVDAE